MWAIRIKSVAQNAVAVLQPAGRLDAGLQACFVYLRE
jgi:hypothetical protein